MRVVLKIHILGSSNDIYTPNWDIECMTYSDNDWVNGTNKANCVEHGKLIICCLFWILRRFNILSVVFIFYLFDKSLLQRVWKYVKALLKFTSQY